MFHQPKVVPNLPSKERLAAIRHYFNELSRKGKLQWKLAQTDPNLDPLDPPHEQARHRRDRLAAQLKMMELR